MLDIALHAAHGEFALERIDEKLRLQAGDGLERTDICDGDARQRRCAAACSFRLKLPFAVDLQVSQIDRRLIDDIGFRCLDRKCRDLEGAGVDFDRQFLVSEHERFGGQCAA